MSTPSPPPHIGIFSYQCTNRPTSPTLLRLRITPDPGDHAPICERPRGSRRPHSDATVAQVRRLIETSLLNYEAISQCTGVGRASICRWTRDLKWLRPPGAPRATDTVPRFRASAKLRRRTLAERIHALAERHVEQVSASEVIDHDKLAAALALLEMARAATRRRPRIDKETGLPRRAINQLYGVDVHAAPREAVHDFLENCYPPVEDKTPRRRGRGRPRKFAEEWMRLKGE
ncbi:hypothetical protein FHS46_003632 [Variibacter gotjawalensis]|uniref:hypothetical protein n=1 Tax=Variibacter gotjawalensis TaxID=1333996 RepID=UPI00102B12F5|nr:hypothetical protein [Variibacter gotjawalensis]NIK49315.1 hypothetical protein [Variibacter gotjawalensis]